MQTEIYKDLFLDALWQIVHFPYWWYSKGLKKAGFFCLSQIKKGWQALALAILFKNFFKSMYGERGFSAYFLSFMVRVSQIIWRVFFMLIWTAAWIIVFILWIFLPLFIIWRLFTG